MAPFSFSAMGSAYGVRQPVSTHMLCFAALLLTVLSGAAAAPAVTSGSCAVDADGTCLNSTVTFSGTDLADVASVRIGLTAADTSLFTCGSVMPSATSVTCRLTAAAHASTGLYPATLVLSSGAEVAAGSLLLGSFYEQKALPRWTSTTNASTYRVTGQSSDWPSTGDTWSVIGTFDPAATYTVAFYNNQKKAAATSPGTPVCAPVTVTATSLTCTITSANGVMGMYNFLVRDAAHNALLLGSTSLYMLSVNPPLPDVTGATGDCAASSPACVSGAALHIVGTNFNYRAAEYQQFFVGVTSAQRSAITLTPTAVDTAGIDVALAYDRSSVSAGSYPVFVKVQVCMMGMMTPLRFVGNLVLGVPDAQGVNFDDMNGQIDAGHYCSARGTLAGPYKAAVAFAVIFAVLFLALVIALIVMCCRCNFVRKSRGKRSVMTELSGAELQSEPAANSDYYGNSRYSYDNDRE